MLIVALALCGLLGGVTASWLITRQEADIAREGTPDTVAVPVHGWGHLGSLRQAGILGVVGSLTTVAVGLSVPLALAAAAVAAVSQLLALFVIDLRTKRLPAVLVWPLYQSLAVWLVVAGVVTGQWPLARITVAALLWGAVYALPWLITGGRGIGFGDVRLAPALGLLLGWIGWGPAVVGLVAGPVIGGFVGLVMVAGRRASRRTALPYGPFLIAGAGVGVLAGPALWSWYLTVTGIA